MLLFEICIMSNWNDHYVIKSKAILTQKVGESSKIWSVSVFERDGSKGGRGGKRKRRKDRDRKRERERGEKEKKTHCVQWCKRFHMVSVCQNISVGELPELSTRTYLVFKPSVNSLLLLYMCRSFFPLQFFFWGEGFSIRVSTGDNLAASMPIIISRESVNHFFFSEEVSRFLAAWIVSNSISVLIILSALLYKGASLIAMATAQ